jgi:FMN phosphatase YigB (HAD superfamily)
VVFDLGGVLLPFDRERRIVHIARETGADPEALRALYAGDLPGRVDVGQADETDIAVALGALAGRSISAPEAIALTLSVFEAPNLPLWDFAARLADSATVAGFTDNPAFVRRAFPPGARLDPVFFSAELGVAKPSPLAFAAVQRGLGVAADEILFIDDSPANVAAALDAGWDAIHFTGNAPLFEALASRGLP